MALQTPELARPRIEAQQQQLGGPLRDSRACSCSSSSQSVLHRAAFLQPVLHHSRAPCPAGPRLVLCATASSRRHSSGGGRRTRMAMRASAAPATAAGTGALLECRQVDEPLGQRTGLFAKQDVVGDTELLTVPEDKCVTRVDADAHDVVGSVASSRGEVVALALWLMAEWANGDASAYAELLSELPRETLSPILWDDADRQALLRGSPVLQEARDRAAAIQQEWQALQQEMAGKGLDPAAFNERSFFRAMSVVLACSVYLPAAQCLALIPCGVSTMQRTGKQGTAAAAEYDAGRGCVVLAAPEFISGGDEVCLFDGRPNGELCLAAGTVEEASPSDFLELPAALVPADRLFSMKKEILQELGFSTETRFPVYADRMPTQLLSYLRLSRVADPAQFALVTFERDAIINELNEYEVLQLLMGECRERLAAYDTAGDTDREVKALQGTDMTPKERLATQLRLEEKRILRGTMDALRIKLAPIRGIPTKGGEMTDPNADLAEIFDTIESLPNVPKKIMNGFLSWARGDNDPDWKR